jgi:RNA-binding protein
MALTGKQRSYLKGLAHELRPTVSIGKAGLTDGVIETIENALRTNELIKGTILETAELDTKEVCNEAAARVHAEFVQAIGRKFVLYRKARDPEKRKIILP